MKSSFSEAAAQAAGSPARRVAVSSTFRRATRFISDVISPRLLARRRIRQRLAEITEYRVDPLIGKCFQPRPYRASTGDHHRQMGHHVRHGVSSISGRPATDSVSTCSLETNTSSSFRCRWMQVVKLISKLSQNGTLRRNNAAARPC